MTLTEEQSGGPTQAPPAGAGAGQLPVRRGMGLKTKIGWTLFAGSFLIWAGLFVLISAARGPVDIAAAVAVLALVSEIMLWSAGLLLGMAFIGSRRGFLQKRLPRIRRRDRSHEASLG